MKLENTRSHEKKKNAGPSPAFTPRKLFYRVVNQYTRARHWHANGLCASVCECVCAFVSISAVEGAPEGGLEDALPAAG